LEVNRIGELNNAKSPEDIDVMLGVRTSHPICRLFVAWTKKDLPVEVLPPKGR
jgi:hypothetical protein